MELEALLTEVRHITIAAGARIQEIRAEPMRTDLKDDDSPVTRADREADTLLRRRLTSLCPAGWLSEETADAPDRLRERRVWVVDPLDGTKEFIQGIPEYAVAVALVEDGEPVLAVVHNPVSGEVFWGARGLGARKGVLRSANQWSEKAVTVCEGNVILASRSELARGEFDPFMPREHEAGSREHGAGKREQRNLLTAHSSRLTDWEVVGRGSIAYKLAGVAAGDGSVTFSRGPKHEWDVCAGALLVEEAGGKATDLFGEPLRFNQPFPKTRGILAGAPRAWEQALAAVKAIGASDRMEELGDRA